MRIRKVKTQSKNTAVQVVSYTKNKTFVHRHIGSAKNKEELSALVESARRWIEYRTGQSNLFAMEERKRNIDTVVGKYKYRGFRYGLVYETINSIFSVFGLLDGRGKTGWKMFLDLALVRAIDPASKRESQRLLESLFGINYDLTSIYRSMPRFCDFKNRAI